MSKREELKDALFARLIDIVQNGVQVVTKEGELVRETAGAPYLQAAIALLKVEDLPGTPAPKTTSEVLQRLQKARPGQPTVN